MTQDTKCECISFVGIATAGKSTLAPMLAERRGWEWMDTDKLIESYYGRPLQEIVDEMGVPKFKECEERIVADLGASRCIIATGGSVVYGPKAVERLKLLGPVVYLEISPETFVERLEASAARGFCQPEGMTILDVYNERQPLYEGASDLAVRTDLSGPEDCIEQIVQWLEARNEKK